MKIVMNINVIMKIMIVIIMVLLKKIVIIY